ncbi:MAG: hypothetical protein LBD75_01965, partial [Candidatus Peribacteria bacterium]|nr:hypothetical protein [Candidatus Peribacteria bacterium]
MPRREGKALKWMINGKGEIDALAEGASEEETKQLKALAKIVNRIDLKEAVDFMDTYRTHKDTPRFSNTDADKEKWIQIIKE